jgi:hypothetical protein
MTRFICELRIQSGYNRPSFRFPRARNSRARDRGLTTRPLPLILVQSALLFLVVLALLFQSGCSGVTSVAASRNSLASPASPASTAGLPAIATQPASQTVSTGQVATFSVAATGTAPLSYQWQKNSANIPGATAPTYSTPATTASDNGAQFAVVISNGVGAVTSSVAILTVNTPPSITAQPVNQAVMAGQSATFSVTVTGTAPLSYQWQKNGAAISGATSPSYTTPATTNMDNGAQFTVRVGNSLGATASNAATLTVTPAPVAPSITSQPTSQSVTAGQTATFSVTATGTAPLSYQWQKNGAAISGATSSSYTTPATTNADNGAQFAVRVSNSVGTATSNAATLTVTPPPGTPSITSQPTGQSVTAGQTATFSVTATGTAPLSYQWQKNGAAISGATSFSYTTPVTTNSDNGAQFVVTVSNSVGTATSNAATLTVTPAPVAPSITSQPTSQSVTAGQAATFSVGATGTAPLSYQWQKNGAVISGATSSSYTTPATTSSDNGSQFAVTITNSVGTATSNTITLTVNTPPSITTQPVNQTVTAGQTASFSVTAGGTAPLSYQWKKNGANISAATASAYTTPATTSSDNGAQFTVVISNVAGTVTSNASTLTVNTPPLITVQPVNQSVVVGQTTIFSVTATGTAPLAYQWQKNGTPISGATSSTYTTPATTSSDNGSQFNVTVTNSIASVTSNTITLTVTAPGQLSAGSSTLSFGNVNVGSSSTQSTTVTNSGAANVTISNVTITGAGLSVSGISNGLVLTPGASVTMNVIFAPASAGSLTGSSVVITSNASNSPLSVSLSGTGVAVQHSAALSWTASTSVVVGYNIYRGGTSGGPYTIINSSPNASTTFTDLSVVSGQTYYYVVTAVNSSNVESINSNQVQAVIP